MKVYKVWVTETYEKCYEVEAEDEFEAQDIAEDLASDDMEITEPENMTDRECEVVS